MKALKRAGDFVGLQSDLPHLPKGSLALTCTACPQEGFNTRAHCEGDSGVPKEMQDPNAPEYVLVMPFSIADLIYLTAILNNCSLAPMGTFMRSAKES